MLRYGNGYVYFQKERQTDVNVFLFFFVFTMMYFLKTDVFSFYSFVYNTTHFEFYQSFRVLLLLKQAADEFEDY